MISIIKIIFNNKINLLLQIKFFQSYERFSKDLKRPQKPIYKDHKKVIKSVSKDQKSRISKTTIDYTNAQLPKKSMDQRLLKKSLLMTNAHFEDGLEPT
jgi:hypothetical protein